MLIGEAPGRDEDEQGLPFVGRAGKLLDRMLAEINLDRSKVYITNVLNWRPPQNREPTPEEAAICLPFLHRHIELADPLLLVLLGAVAVRHVLGINEGITRVRGRWDLFQSAALKRSIPVMPTLHPAYLLRQPAAKRLAWRDLVAVAEKMKQLACLTQFPPHHAGSNRGVCLKKGRTAIVCVLLATATGQARADDGVVGYTVLSPEDVRAYGNLFAAERAGQTAKADAQAAKLQDSSLIGYALAERYLGPRYHSQFGELKSWLVKYDELANAGNIYGLAKKRAPKKTYVPAPRPARWRGSMGDGDAFEDADLDSTAARRALVRMQHLTRQGRVEAADAMLKKLAGGSAIPKSDIDRLTAISRCPSLAGSRDEIAARGSRVWNAAALPPQLAGLPVSLPTGSDNSSTQRGTSRRLPKPDAARRAHTPPLPSGLRGAGCARASRNESSPFISAPPPSRRRFTGSWLQSCLDATWARILPSPISTPNPSRR
jgi:uracil-DNA glycosylase family 4